MEGKTFLVIVNCGRKKDALEEQRFTIIAKDRDPAKKGSENYLASKGYKFANFQEILEVEVEKREWQK
jgi:hypothetical protein